MTNFIVAHNTHEAIELGLFKDVICVDTIVLRKMELHRLIIPSLEHLLTKHAMTLSDVSFIAAYQGPAPFTTLRILLTVMNGISFASSIPLVGIDGLRALVTEYAGSHPVTVGLMNAFNQELYYGIMTSDGQCETGYKNKDLLIADLYERYGQHGPVYFIGQGVVGVQDQIVATWGDAARIADPLPLFPSLDYLGSSALMRWQRNECERVLYPLYLKQHPAEL